MYNYLIQWYQKICKIWGIKSEKESTFLEYNPENQHPIVAKLRKYRTNALIRGDVSNEKSLIEGDFYEIWHS